MAPSTSRMGSSQAARTPVGGSGLPLIQCPHCGQARIVELISQTDLHPLERFFKCPRKYTKFPLCDFYMFEEEYANYLLNMGIISESMMCHYRPLEAADDVEETVQSEINGEVQVLPMKKEKERQRNIVSTKKRTGKHGYMQMMMCIGVAVLVLLGINSIILVLLVVIQMFK